MLLFIVLCAILRTLRGASLPPPPADSSSATVDTFGLVAREALIAPDDGGQRIRTVYDIVKSCFWTIFACVWQSAHPNINGPRDSGWTCLKRRIILMLYVLIAPEMILLWALFQRSGASEIAEMYNKEFAKPGNTKTKRSLWKKVVDWFVSLWGNVVGWFQPLSKESTWRGQGQIWTTTHGSFIQMGGFILYENGYPIEVLDYNRLAELLRNKAIIAPAVTERNLQDRSTGNIVSKGIVMLQTMWFVLQCCARVGQRLPLSELEVLTLAFAVINVAIYVAWWNKPQGVDTAICVPLQRADDATTSLTGNEAHESPANSKPTNLPQTDYRLSKDDQPSIQPDELRYDESTGQKHSWLRRKLQEDRKHYSAPVFFLFCMPYRVVASIFHFARKVASGDGKFKKTELRVPMLYSSLANGIGIAQTLLVICATTLFGAIHLLAWASKFPSPRDLVLWRVSAIIMTVEPLLIVATGLLNNSNEDGTGIIVILFAFLTFIMIPLYIAARFVVITIALLAIRHPPPNVLLDVPWTSYLPHF